MASFDQVQAEGLEINCSSFVKSLDKVGLYIGIKKRGVLTIDDEKYLDRLRIVEDINRFYNELIDSFIKELVPYIVYEEDDDLDDEDDYWDDEEEDDSEDHDSSENDESIDSEEIKKNQKDYEKSLVKSLKELKKEIPMFIKDTQSIKYYYEVDFAGECYLNYEDTYFRLYPEKKESDYYNDKHYQGIYSKIIKYNKKNNEWTTEEEISFLYYIK